MQLHPEENLKLVVRSIPESYQCVADQSIREEVLTETLLSLPSQPNPYQARVCLGMTSERPSHWIVLEPMPDDDGTPSKYMQEAVPLPSRDEQSTTSQKCKQPSDCSQIDTLDRKPIPHSSRVRRPVGCPSSWSKWKLRRRVKALQGQVHQQKRRINDLEYIIVQLKKRVKRNLTESNNMDVVRSQPFSFI